MAVQHEFRGFTSEILETGHVTPELTMKQTRDILTSELLETNAECLGTRTGHKAHSQGNKA